jgi:Tfp pilus assembly protein PilF/putative intracellular protease/amidase
MGRADWLVEDVAGLLRDQDGTIRKCCLLIGAGASRSAGVGISTDFVDLIQARHLTAFNRAKKQAVNGKPTYGDCMSELTEGQQAELVREQVERARINWAHIGIARLEAAGYVDRILTTNFDPLASRACALFNRFPAVYDLAALRDADATSGRARFLPAFVRGPAIYHLHGQHTGFMLLNDKAKLELQAERIEPALEEAVQDRTVIICGYSGENDPLVDRLSRRDVYPHGLIWVCHNDESPCPEVVEKLINRIDDCHLVRNMPADRFFTELANALDLPQPPFLTQPFQHMLTALDHVRPYTDLTETGLDLLEHARQLLVTAQSGQAENSPEQVEISELMAQEKFQQVFDSYSGKIDSLDENDRNLVAWAAVMWGNALFDQAGLKRGEEAEIFFAQAGEKYAAALTIKSDMHEVLYNWANVFLEQAKLKQGEEAEALFAQAEEKYGAALAIKPDKYDALNNWGNALSEKAKRKRGEEAYALFAKAGEKYAAALVTHPGRCDAPINWGNALVQQAKLKQGAEAEVLFAEAGDKYAAALAISPDAYDALNNWGNALCEQARLKPGKKAETLLAEASNKYEAALAIKDDAEEVLQGLAYTMMVRASRVSETKKGLYLNRAEDILLHVRSLRPAKAAYNLACIAGLRGRAKEAAKWLRIAKAEGDLPDCAHIAADSDLENVRGAAVFIRALGDVGCEQ